jgi:uncharacterized protein
MQLLIFILFMIIGFATGFVNATGGGGALITTPLLLAFGVNPYATLATNKLVPIGGLLIGGAKYYSAKVFRWSWSLLLLAVITAVGAFIAANLTLTINAVILKYIILITTLSIVTTIILKKDKKSTESTGNDKINIPNIKFLFAVFFISIYQGSIGIGGGIFLASAFRHFLKYSFVKSAALMNALTVIIMLVSAMTFAFKGVINYEYGIPLFIGSIVGGYAGAHIAIKKGDRLLKTITILIAAALVVKVLFS